MSTPTESTAPRPDEVKAGDYEVTAVNLDVVTSKLGEPFDYKRYFTGDTVHLDAAEARRHLQAGSVIVPGSRERAAAEQAKATYEAALAALAALPAEQREALGGDELVVRARRRRPRAVPSTPPGDPAPATVEDEEDGGGPTADEQDDDSVDDGGPTADEQAAGTRAGEPERPKRVESKATWLDYVVSKGYLTQEAAEAMSKDDIVAAVYAREDGGS